MQPSRRRQGKAQPLVPAFLFLIRKIARDWKMPTQASSLLMTRPCHHLSRRLVRTEEEMRIDTKGQIRKLSYGIYDLLPWSVEHYATMILLKVLLDPTVCWRSWFLTDEVAMLQLLGGQQQRRLADGLQPIRGRGLRW
ncbi:hypothetical protein U9M48_006063 [Paspalum notatum var. saurae]|uniref:Uncharacterized protein n=1 Tax=Paspalum notatum var. saurae TaxID=547442 RepID=A0AAQ3PRG0_PASNO